VKSSDKYTFIDIKKFVLKHVNVDESSLLLKTRVGEDLCIVGDDAHEFLSDYMKVFNVDLSNMNFSDYFPSEATAEMNVYLTKHSKSKLMKIFGFVDLWFWKIISKNNTYKTITLMDLLESAKKGSWAGR
jgi:hypothetical protein